MTMYSSMHYQTDLFGPTDTSEALTVLSFGGGQDSTTIIEKIIDDEAFRRRYVEGRLLVVMSDTGDEFPETG